MAAFTVDRRNLNDEALILDSLMVQEELPHLVALVDALQQASTPVDFHHLQQRLLGRSFALQTVADELRTEIAKTKDQLRELTSRKPLTLGEVREAQGRLARQELTERACKAVAHALRCVGDGMAWKALRYDRATIAVLGQGQRVGRLANAAGLDAELAAAAKYWDSGTFAIHNDLTNCLRTGDLTLPFEPGGLAIREVKAGISTRRQQREEAEFRVSFLQNGHGRWDGSAPTARLVRQATPFRARLDALRRLLTRARSDGYSVEQLCPSSLLVCMDSRVSRGEPGIDVVTDRAIAHAGWHDETRLLLTTTSVRRMRERRHHFPYLAPLTIYPLPPVDVAELLLGPLEYVTVLNAPALEHRFAATGLQAEVVTRKPEATRVFLRVANGVADIEMPALVGEQMLAELMDPACLVEAVGVALQELAAGVPPGPALHCMADEHRTWGPTRDTPRTPA